MGFFNKIVGILRKLLMPLKVLYFGRIALLCYLSFLFVSIFLICKGISSFSAPYIADLQRSALFNRHITSRIAPFMQISLVILAAPLILTLLTLPTRIIWIDRRLCLKELLGSCLKQAINCGYAFWITARPAFYLLIPGLAMAFLYFAFVRNVAQPFLYYAYTGACCLVVALTIYKTLPVLMTPLLTICGGFHPRQALYRCHAVLGPKKMDLALGLVLWTATLAGLSHTSVSLILLSHPWLSWLLLGIALWYLVTFLSLVIIKAIAEHENMSSTKEKAARPRPPHAFHAAAAEFAQTRRSMAAENQRDGPVSVQVTRIWVRD